MAIARIQNAPAVGRVTRSPQHTWNLRTRPYQVQPILLAPVLPGETLKNFNMQARVVTDPIRNALVGWHKEYYFFYVKLRDMEARDSYVQMLVDPDYDVTSIADATPNTQLYYGGGTGNINWLQEALETVVESYMRFEGEAYGDFLIDGLPAAGVNRTSWLNSAVTAAAMGNAEDIDVDANTDGTITAGEVDKALRMWQMQVQGGITTQSYEDWLRTFGVRLPQAEQHQPELLRYVRTWSYPSNTVDPTTGDPSSAVSWSIAERADKDRFFKEPGFILGVTISRPKVYLRPQAGYIAAYMNDAMAWLPAILRDDWSGSWRHFPATTGPLPANADANGYWFDMKDLLLYGDQMLNFDPAATDANIVDLPTTALQKRYVDLADVDALFTDETVEAPYKRWVREDGVWSASILGALQDTSAAT